MKYLTIFFLISILVFNSCKEEESTAPEVTTPSAPTLSTPIDSAKNQSTSPTLSWHASPGASSYTLQVSTSSAFSSYVYNQNELTNTSQQVNGLSNSTLYYWRVSATNSSGTSGWSTPLWSFTTADPAFICGSTVTYGGKTYNTVQIGNQCWLKENLDVGTMIQGTDTSNNNGIIEKYCYNNDTNYCNTYGGLYKWDEAMQYSAIPGARGICPSGWHVPAKAEFDTLASIVGGDGNALKAIGQGGDAGVGTDTSGFSALLSGNRHADGYFNGLGDYALFWSSTDYSTSFAYNMSLNYNLSDIAFYNYNKENGFGIRCVKD